MSDEKQEVDKPQEQKQDIDNQYALQMQIITFQDQSINNLKNIILEKESDLQRQIQENVVLKQQLTTLQQTINNKQQQASHLTQQLDQANQKLQSQLSKAQEELAKFKNTFNQNAIPNVMMDALQLKEQVVTLQIVKSKLEIDLKEAQGKLKSAHHQISELQREIYQFQSLQVSQQQSYPQQNRYGNIESTDSKQLIIEENNRNLRRLQIRSELSQLSQNGRNQQQQKRMQQLQEELSMIEQQM